MTIKQYQNQIKHIVELFKGKKKEIILSLKKSVSTAVKSKKFENASLLQRQIYALEHIRDVALIKDDSVRISTGGEIVFRIEAYDVAHLSGQASYGVMVVMEDGYLKKDEYRLFTIAGIGNNDLASLEHILKRRIAHREWKPARIVVVDGGELQLKIAQDFFNGAGPHVKIVAVTKDEHHRAREVIGAPLTETEKTSVLALNAEAHRFAITRHRRKMRKDFLH